MLFCPGEHRFDLKRTPVIDAKEGKRTKNSPPLSSPDY